jgi:hypothetical protein
MNALSAVDAVSPAFETAQRQLFQPFQLAVWARLAVVGLATGEFAGGGGGGGADTIRIPVPQTVQTPEKDYWLASTGWHDPAALLLLIPAALAVLFVLWLAVLYINSIFRFILLDAVLTGRCGLRAGWRRWQGPGSRYFLWQLGFALVTLAALAVVVGGPILFAWRAGWFADARGHLGRLLLGLLLLVILLIGLVIVSALIAVFAKDFVVPLMAFGELGALDAWRRLLPMLRADRWGYTGYILIKIALAVGSAVLFGIVGVVVLLVLGVPLGILAAVAVKAGWFSAWMWTPATIAAVVVAALVALAVLLYVFSFISVPAVIFFQAYTVHFFGGRYPPLGERLAPASAPPAPDAVPVPAS